MINIPIVYHIIIVTIFIALILINLPQCRKRFNINSLIHIDFINNTFSVILGFYLSAILALNIYNNQLQQKNNEDKNNVLHYLDYLDNNLKEVSVDKLEQSINVGYINYDFFDSIQNIGDNELNAKYFKLIGYLKYLKNTFYEIHNAHLINPKANPIRADEAKFVNSTINYIKAEIKELKSSLTQYKNE